MVRIVPTVSEIVSRNISVEDFPKGHEILPNSTEEEKKRKGSTIYRKLGYFLTMRMMIAVLMSSCLMAFSVTTTNLAGSLVCMVAKEDESIASSPNAR